METLTRHSWIHYTVCWIVKLVHGNTDQTLVNSLHGLLNCEIGGLMCHVITTEYRTCVHCIHVMYHLICDALVHVIYFVVSGQYSYSILLYNWIIIREPFFLFFSKHFYLFCKDYSTSYTIMLIGTDVCIPVVFYFCYKQITELELPQRNVIASGLTWYLKFMFWLN